MEKRFCVGVLDYSIYLPEETITAEELSEQVNIPAKILREKMGINKKHLGGPEDHPGIMATKAYKALLEKTKINPKEIDMILYAGEAYSEYICWTVGIKIQNEIGADNAYAWDLSYRCAATPLALKIAKNMMYADETLNTVLIAGGNSNAYLIDYKDPNQSFMFDMSPGGFALILKRDHFENELLGSGIVSDHVFCDDVKGKYGGTLYPITEEIASDPEMLRKAKLIDLPDPEGMKKRLGERSLGDFDLAVRKALKASNLNERDIDFIGINHIGPRAHYAIMAGLGIDKEKTVYLSDDGHCGHVDQFLALDYGIKEGKVKDGTVCALLGAGTGYAFACSLVRWGKIQK
ncbi:3-oxoacyl-ACP synthase [Clostridium grantii]|uniref:3-oxoacyl-[acyl-carrier-protein] synthase-3 n=1 Tax=Clostridium grantii DSM 8605 TaxID=1121316 RepID=A0A1M5S865_9CLOT|nr:3-oxoacyl-ACP synthase [Clostridium grantii]SHH34630.1 3-oxoacyl-[acyl-carrier-protein] synthase-3 [Clostridium grantii DSM 8605]